MTEPKKVPFPRILSRAVDDADQKLVEFQTLLRNEILDSSVEVMGLMGLNASDGWRIDLESRQFVNSNYVETEPEETETPENVFDEESYHR